MVNLSASAVHAETLICNAFKSVIDRRPRPLHTRQVRRQAVAVAAIDQQRHLPVEQIGQIGHGVFHAVHGKGDVAAVEVTAVQDRARRRRR